MTNLSDTLAALDLSPENIAEQVQALRNHADERQRKGWLTSAHNLRVGADYMEALSNELAAYRTGQLVPVPSVERVLTDTAAHLAAAISLLENGGKAAKKAAPSDRMFDQMVLDYKASLERARQAISAMKGETDNG